MNEFHNRPVHIHVHNEHIQEEALYLGGGGVDGSCMIPVLAFKLSRLHDTFYWLMHEQKIPCFFATNV